MTTEVAAEAELALARISTVLAGHEAQPIADAEWMPGDPLWERPDGYADEQVIRPIFQIIDDNGWRIARCLPCQVSWVGTEPCWMCGETVTAPASTPRLTMMPHLAAAVPRTNMATIFSQAARASISFRDAMTRTLEAIASVDWLAIEESLRQVERRRPHGPPPLPINGTEYHRRRASRSRR